MASIAGISLTKLSTAQPARSAVAFYLFDASHESYRALIDTHWEGEIISGQRCVVVRSNVALGADSLVERAIEAAERFLDVVSVQCRDHLSIRAPLRENLLLLTVEGRNSVLHNDDAPMKLRAGPIEIVSIIDGKPVPRPAPTIPPWSSALRYYRLSQNSRDVYEAYRNMFLALEAQLDLICPKQPNEREKEWLRRSLTHISSAVDLPSVTPPGKDPIAHFIGTQYDNTRVRLFHAKHGVSLLPNHQLSYEHVTLRYRTLAAIVEAIIQKFMPLRMGGARFSTSIMKAQEPLL